MHSCWRRVARALLAIALVAFCHASARADIGVVLADPTSIGVSWFTHAGHSLVYLSDVCAASPVRARLCGPGELGSIVTAYPDFYETGRYAWNLSPLNLYLEGISVPGERLLYASPNVKAALELHARVNFLRGVCGNTACPQHAHAYWRDLVGSTVDRDIFVYAVHTSRSQDAAIVRWLNSRSNDNHYNSLTNNCSNFTQSLVNTVFPHVVYRDWLNDLGMMSPKGAARSFTRWAAKQPGLGLYAMHFAQQPGSMPRSDVARSGTEDGFHMKKYMIPAALIGDHEIAGSFLVSYYFTGQFGLYKEYAKYAMPSPISTEDSAEDGPDDAPEALATSRSPAIVDAALASPAISPAIDQGQSTVGTAAEWALYRRKFQAILHSEEARAWSPTPKHPFPAWFAKAESSVDADGQPYLSTGPGPSARMVGLGSGDVLAPDSDPELAFQLLMGRVQYALSAKNHLRETMVAFREDWALLQQAQQRLQTGMQPGMQPRPVGANLPAIAAQR